MGRDKPPIRQAVILFSGVGSVFCLLSPPNLNLTMRLQTSRAVDHDVPGTDDFESKSRISDLFYAHTEGAR